MGSGDRDEGGAWALASVQPPWGSGTSIYAHIKAHIAPDQKNLTDGGETLPDERDDGKIRWVAGGLDGASGHHCSVVDEPSRAKMIHRALSVVVADASAVKLEKLYGLVLQATTLNYIDALLQQLVEKQDIDADRLEELMLWLAKGATDREVVKFAIAVLSVLSASDNSALLLILGRHEELTLYAAMALSNSDAENAEQNLFTLAKQVDGWGRIQIVERLAKTRDPDIKAWLLREGYKNQVLYEYLAYTCACAGDLRAALNEDEVDDELLAGAGDIIEALISGGPAEDMSDYPHGAAVVDRYLQHLDSSAKDLKQLIVVDRILKYVDEHADWKQREVMGWTEALRKKLRMKSIAIKSQPHWKESVDAALASQERMEFHIADQAARVLGIDTWDKHFERLESGSGDGWYNVMQTAVPSRIERVVALAQKQLGLDEIASGPAEELGLGLEWADHNNLGFVLQDLNRFPTMGWPVIRAGIRSPVIRNRHMALRALSAWGHDRWPEEARALLQQTLDDDPNDNVRNSIETLLSGKRLEET